MRRSTTFRLVVLTLAALIISACGGGSGSSGGCSEFNCGHPLAFVNDCLAPHWIYLDPAFNQIPFTQGSSQVSAAFSFMPASVCGQIYWVASSESVGQQIVQYENLPAGSPGIVVNPSSPALRDDIEEQAAIQFVWPTLSDAEQAEWADIAGEVTPPDQSFGAGYAAWLDDQSAGYGVLQRAVSAAEQPVPSIQPLREWFYVAGVFSTSPSMSRPFIMFTGTLLSAENYKFTLSGDVVTAIAMYQHQGSACVLTEPVTLQIPVQIPQTFLTLVPVGPCTDSNGCPICE
jgi:hypothetical protein